MSTSGTRQKARTLGLFGVLLVLLTSLALPNVLLSMRWISDCNSATQEQPHNHSQVIQEVQVVPPLFPSTEELSSLRRAVVLVSDETYRHAAADLAKSMRKDGGWTGDIVIVYCDLYNDASITAFETLDPMKKALEQAGLSGDSAIQLLSAKYDLLDETIPLPQQPLPRCVLGSRGTRHLAYYCKILIYMPWFRQHYDRILYVDGCATIHPKPKAIQKNVIDLVFFQKINSHGVLLAVPDPWRWSYKGLVSQLSHPSKCRRHSALYREALEDARIDTQRTGSYFNSGLTLFDTSILTPTTFHEMNELYNKYQPILKGGDQIIQSIYWHHIRNVYRPMPFFLVGLDFIPYDFLAQIKPVAGRVRYVITSGNPWRDVCSKRPTNAVSVAKTQGKKVNGMAAASGGVNGQTKRRRRRRRRRRL